MFRPDSFAIPAGYEPLTTETLPSRLGSVAALQDRLGPPASWSVREVGDGNLNLVFVVQGENGALVSTLR